MLIAKSFFALEVDKQTRVTVYQPTNEKLAFVIFAQKRYVSVQPIY